MKIVGLKNTKGAELQNWKINKMDQHSYTPRSQNVAGEGAVATHDGFVASAAEGEVAEPQEECDEDDDGGEVPLAVVAVACGKRYRMIPKPKKETTDQQNQQLGTPG